MQRNAFRFFYLVCMQLALCSLLPIASAEPVSITLDSVDTAASTYARAVAELEVWVEEEPIEPGGESHWYLNTYTDSYVEWGAGWAVATASALSPAGDTAETEITSQVAVLQSGPPGAQPAYLVVRGWISDTYVSSGTGTHSGEISNTYSGNLTIGTSSAFPLGSEGLTLHVEAFSIGQGIEFSLNGGQTYKVGDYTDYVSLDIPVLAGDTVFVDLLAHGELSPMELFETGGDIIFTVTPEPATLGLLAIGGLAIFGSNRGKRNFLRRNDR